MVKNIGQGGLHTSFIVKTKTLKSMVAGASCQENLNAEIDNPKDRAWLQLNKTIQNIKGKGIATMVGTIEAKEVIVKIQNSANALQEYDIQQKLKEAEVDGFISFQCFAKCTGDKDYIESFAFLNDYTRLCKSKGHTMGIIIMPYYKNKSFESFLKDCKHPEYVAKAIDITIQIIQNMFRSYEKTGFTHGDLFSKNVVLDDNYDPIIIDFEKSNFNSNLMRFWRDIDDFIGDIARYLLTSELDTICREQVFMNLAFNKPPTQDLINRFIESLRNLYK